MLGETRVRKSLGRSYAITIIVFTLFTLASCATSNVGGRYEYRKVGNAETETLGTECNGSCAMFSPDGTCIKWAADISDVCIDYFSRSAAIKHQWLDKNTLRHVQETVAALCRGGTVAGHKQLFEISNEDVSTVVRLPEKGDTANSHRTMRFSRTEWEGIQADIREGYSACIRDVTPKFLARVR